MSPARALAGRCRHMWIGVNNSHQHRDRAGDQRGRIVAFLTGYPQPSLPAGRQRHLLLVSFRHG